MRSKLPMIDVLSPSIVSFNRKSEIKGMISHNIISEEINNVKSDLPIYMIRMFYLKHKARLRYLMIMKINQ